MEIKSHQPPKLSKPCTLLSPHTYWSSTQFPRPSLNAVSTQDPPMSQLYPEWEEDSGCMGRDGQPPQVSPPQLPYWVMRALAPGNQLLRGRPHVEKQGLMVPIHWGAEKFKVLLVAQSCSTLCNPMDCSPPGSTVHGISQARILEWVAVSSSKGSSWPRNCTWVSCIVGRFFTEWATREAHARTVYKTKFTS